METAIVEIGPVLRENVAAGSCYNKSLTTLWKGPHRETQRSSLPFAV